MIYGTEKPKISLLLALIPVNPIVGKTFSSLIYTNVMIPYLKMISFRKLVHNVF